MSSHGWLMALICRAIVAILSTPTIAMRYNGADTKERTRVHGRCFTIEQEGYTLLGCYERKVFAEDKYVTLIPVPGGLSTAASCLEGCARTVPRNTTSGDYSRVAVSEGRTCLCGTSLSERAQRVDTSLCDAPCSGDPDVSCGGNLGYALVYVLDDRTGAGNVTKCQAKEKCGRKPSRATPVVSCLTQTATASASPGSSSPPTTSAPSRPHRNPAGEPIRSEAVSSTDTKSTVAVALGSITTAAALFGVVLLLIFLRRRRRRRGKPNSASHAETGGHSTTEPKPLLADAAPTPPSTAADGRRTSQASGTSQASALTSASGSRQPSRGKQDISPAGTEPSNLASLVVLSASHVVVKPVAGRVSVVDARGAPRRRYSLPLAVPRGGLAAGMRAPGYAQGFPAGTPL